MNINLGAVRKEATRLIAAGPLTVEWQNDAIPNDRQKIHRGACIGFAIDGEERDCLLFLMPYGMSRDLVVRCVVASQIIRLEASV